MRKNNNNFYHTFGYPFIPLFFIVIEGCMMIYVFANRPVQSLAGIGITLAGLLVWFILIKSDKNVTL